METPALLIGSSTDMLSKAKRELARLRDDVNIDTVFNFFVTAYHVQDYLRAEAPQLKIDIDKLLADPDVVVCRSICNQGNTSKLIEKLSRSARKCRGVQDVSALGSLARW